MNNNLDTFKNKKILLIAAALILFLGAGSVGYLVLRSVSPRANTTGTGEPNSKEELTLKAEESNRAAQTALSNNDPATAAKKFAEAKELYSKAGQTEKSIQAGEQQDVAEQEAEVVDANTEVDAPSRGTNQ